MAAVLALLIAACLCLADAIPAARAPHDGAHVRDDAVARARRLIALIDPPVAAALAVS